MKSWEVLPPQKPRAGTVNMSPLERANHPALTHPQTSLLMGYCTPSHVYSPPLATALQKALLSLPELKLGRSASKIIERRKTPWSISMKSLLVNRDPYQIAGSVIPLHVSSSHLIVIRGSILDRFRCAIKQNLLSFSWQPQEILSNNLHFKNHQNIRTLRNLSLVDQFKQLESS